MDLLKRSFLEMQAQRENRQDSCSIQRYDRRLYRLRPTTLLRIVRVLWFVFSLLIMRRLHTCSTYVALVKYCSYISAQARREAKLRKQQQDPVTAQQERQQIPRVYQEQDYRQCDRT